MRIIISKKKNWFVENVQLLVLAVVWLIVKNMERTLLNSNANSVVQLHNGFAGVILIFVNHAIKSNVVETMCQEKQKINFQNVLVRLNVHLK
jgi:hypothetical protein